MVWKIHKKFKFEDGGKKQDFGVTIKMIKAILEIWESEWVKEAGKS